VGWHSRGHIADLPAEAGFVAALDDLLSSYFSRATKRLCR